MVLLSKKKEWIQPDESKLGLDDLVAVHLTDFLPKNGSINCLNSVFPDSILRTTVHFTINHPVGNVGMYGNWDRKKYAVLVPMRQLAEENHVENFATVDTYLSGDAKLPVGTTVVVTPDAYEDLVDEGILSRDELLQAVADNQYMATAQEKKVIQKDGINYVILPATCLDSRNGAISEMEDQGFTYYLPGEHGAFSSGFQKEIASEVGASTSRKHSGSYWHNLEHLSGSLSCLSAGEGRSQVESYLKLVKEFGSVEALNREEGKSFGGLLSTAQYEGQKSLESLNSVIVSLEKMASQAPEHVVPRIRSFIDINKKVLREYIPQDIIEHYGLDI